MKKIMLVIFLILTFPVYAATVISTEKTEALALYKAMSIAKKMFAYRISMQKPGNLYVTEYHVSKSTDDKVTISAEIDYEFNTNKLSDSTKNGIIRHALNNPIIYVNLDETTKNVVSDNLREYGFLLSNDLLEADIIIFGDTKMSVTGDKIVASLAGKYEYCKKAFDINQTIEIEGTNIADTQFQALKSLGQKIAEQINTQLLTFGCGDILKEEK